jgi:hypothetical protein
MAAAIPEAPDPARCPRCGRPNACAMAAGDDAAPCWCTQVKVPAALLAGLPAAAVGTACLCAACIAEATPR